MSSESSANKSANAFRTISEVSEELDIPQHVLRFWETKFTQVKPMKRAGRRRYYRPADIDLLSRIRDLLYKDGLTIKGVQKLFKDNGGRLPKRLDSKAAASAAASSSDLFSDSQPGTSDNTSGAVEALADLMQAARGQLPPGGQDKAETGVSAGTPDIGALHEMLSRLQKLRDRLDD
ncbi:MerR family transcriptional regulator [Kiloniella sp. b19]|uniref:MerR family transcriptional regulator n=1 Tax=Kiloniella sp. GXU_MW_B19 TaxID=3141326 RepID=UPI0031D65A1F